jgi:hypothetical protein
MYASLKDVFSCLDFREVFVWVISSSYRVTSTLIIRTTSHAEPILIEEVIKIIVVEIVQIIVA